MKLSVYMQIKAAVHLDEINVLFFSTYLAKGISEL